jgi:hypothetical protein
MDQIAPYLLIFLLSVLLCLSQIWVRTHRHRLTLYHLTLHWLTHLLAVRYHLHTGLQTVLLLRPVWIVRLCWHTGSVPFHFSFFVTAIFLLDLLVLDLLVLALLVLLVLLVLVVLLAKIDGSDGERNPTGPKLHAAEDALERGETS